MKLPIPQDWDGETWLCTQVQWPDSPMYRAFLRGFLSYLMRGRLYDEATGSIKGAQEVGWQIYAKNHNFTPCETCEPCEHNRHTCSCGGSSSGDFLSFDEWMELMGAIVTGAHFDSQGRLVLEFGECCEKIVSQQLTTPTGATTSEPKSIKDMVSGSENPMDDIPDLEPENTGDWACRKAYALGKAYEDLVLAAQGATNMTPWAAQNYLQSELSYLKLDNQEAYSLWANIQVIERIVPVVQIDWSTEQTETLICKMAAKLSDSSSGMTENEFSVFFSEIANAEGGELGAFCAQELAKAVGKSNWRKAISSGIFYNEANCDCPEIVAPIDYGVIPVAYDWIHAFDWRTGNWGWVISQCTRDDSGAWNTGVHNGPTMSFSCRGVGTGTSTTIKYIRHEFGSWISFGYHTDSHWFGWNSIRKWNEQIGGQLSPEKQLNEASDDNDVYYFHAGSMVQSGGTIGGVTRLKRTVIAGAGADPFAGLVYNTVGRA